VADVKHICSLLETTRADSDIIMTTLVNKIRNFDVGVQYMYLRTFGRALGLGPEWREYLPDCHLKCAIYAAKNDRVNLAKYLFTTDTAGYLPQGLADFASPINISMLWSISYADLCVDAGVSGSANDIIELIADEQLRAYFNLISRSYEELLADIVAGRSQEIRKKVTAGGVKWKDFRSRLSSDYFVHNRRGTVATIVCEMLQAAGDMG
jgi:hypothetical protein